MQFSLCSEPTPFRRGTTNFGYASRWAQNRLCMSAVKASSVVSVPAPTLNDGVLALFGAIRLTMGPQEPNVVRQQLAETQDAKDVAVQTVTRWHQSRRLALQDRVHRWLDDNVTRDRSGHADLTTAAPSIDRFFQTLGASQDMARMPEGSQCCHSYEMAFHSRVGFFSFLWCSLA